MERILRQAYATSVRQDGPPITVLSNVLHVVKVLSQILMDPFVKFVQEVSSSLRIPREAHAVSNVQPGTSRRMKEKVRVPA